jgi:hypothetical protein
MSGPFVWGLMFEIFGGLVMNRKQPDREWTVTPTKVRGHGHREAQLIPALSSSLVPYNGLPGGIFGTVTIYSRQNQVYP